MANANRTLRAAAVIAADSTYTGAAQDTPYHKGVTIDVVTSAETDTGSIVVKLQRKIGTATWVDIAGATTAAITTETTTTLTLCPGITASANVAISQPLPRNWRVVATEAAGGSFTVAIYATLYA